MLYKTFGKMDRVKPQNVSSRHWEKFKCLEKRTDEVTKRSTEKRIMHLKKQLIDTVNKEFTSSEDKDILQKYDVKFGPPVDHQQPKKGKRKSSNDGPTGSQEVISSIDGLQSYMDINRHLHLTDHSRPPPPTSLEKQMDTAISCGNLKEAEKLSDHLADREAGEKVVAAIDAKNFLELKKSEEWTKKAKKKKKLNWGFEPKHRWETKGNM